MRQEPFNFFLSSVVVVFWVSGSGVDESFLTCWIRSRSECLSLWISSRTACFSLRNRSRVECFESPGLEILYVECLSLQIRNRSECFSLWIMSLKLKLVVKVSSVCFRIFPLHSLAETRKFPLLPSQPQVKLYKFSNSSPLCSRLWPSCQSNLPAPPLKGRKSSAMPF